MNTYNNSVINTSSKVAISSSEGLYFFQPQEIIRMEASSNYTCIYFTNRKPMVIAKVLGEYEEMLGSLGFVRTHRSHLVNTQHILFIDPVGNIIMQDTSKAEISRRKKKEVMRALKNAA
ncbi:MAG TPA: LytTR family DNA-binding domain-containing protein [Chitinophagaceae bacterium]